jgi:hypothetical protein
MPYQFDAHVIAFVRHQREQAIIRYPETFKRQFAAPA